MAEKIVIAFSGPSNSGKTSLIVQIAEQLKNNYDKKVAIIKHDPKDKARFDVEGKDSYKFFECGAEVIVTSPKRTTYFSQKEKTLDEIIIMLKDFDILLIEGHKDFLIPRIGVFYKKIEDDYLKFIDVLAVNKELRDNNFLKKYSHIPYLDLNNIDEIIDWIFKNGKKLL